tara:strand:+ start:110 stop:682 length:573 start_codon:yes stop_codon:yes gene_type:complete
MSSILKVDQLKDSGGNAIITSNGSGTFTSSLPNTGITMVDQFRLTANITTPDGELTSNLERVDDATFGSIGTGMTNSSGIFTFPQTGIYLIMVQAGISYPNVADNQSNVFTKVSSDSGSNFEDAGRAAAGSNSSSGNSFFTVFSQSFVDVTNISTFQVKFNCTSFGSGVELVGNTDMSITSFSFIRLGDT